MGGTFCYFGTFAGDEGVLSKNWGFLQIDNRHTSICY